MAVRRLRRRLLPATARHSGKVLDVFNWSGADGANIVQWSDHIGANQQFQLADSPDGYVRLINRNSGKVLEVQGASTADGANVVQYADWGGANQQWQLVPVDGTDQGTLPSSFQWGSSGVLAGPRPDPQNPDVVAIKDFSVVRHNSKWQMYATAASPSTGWSLVHFAFGDWPQAGSAQHTYLENSGIGPGYRAAPQVLFFAPQNLWYLVYQTQPPTYSTSTNPADPLSWTTPRTFIANEPPIVEQNNGPGTWIDFWVICDSASCFLFFSDDNGHMYRAQIRLGNFPNGFGNTRSCCRTPSSPCSRGPPSTGCRARTIYGLSPNAATRCSRRPFKAPRNSDEHRHLLRCEVEHGETRRLASTC